MLLLGLGDLNLSNSHVSSCDSEACLLFNYSITCWLFYLPPSMARGSTLELPLLHVIASWRWIQLKQPAVWKGRGGGGCICILSASEESFVSPQRCEITVLHSSSKHTLLYMKGHKRHALANIERGVMVSFEHLGFGSNHAPASGKLVHECPATVIHETFCFCSLVVVFF